jgi:hypothetical protein
VNSGFAPESVMDSCGEEIPKIAPGIETPSPVRNPSRC